MTPSIAEARALQEQLRAQVVASDELPTQLRFVAGADVSYDRGSSILFAAVVVLDAETLELVEVASTRAHARFPYVPGYSSFRELPPLEEAFARLRARPDLRALRRPRPRASAPLRAGVAPRRRRSVSRASAARRVGSSGEHRAPGPRRGAHSALRDGGETIGEVLRTREGVAPIYVSVGHRVSLATARRLALRFSPRFRIPEPIRAAHAEVNRLRLGG